MCLLLFDALPRVPDANKDNCSQWKSDCNCTQEMRIFEKVARLANTPPLRAHGYPASQPVAAPGVQIPPWQLSFVVHGFPSSQEDPSTFAGLLHLPVAASQVPTRWH